MEHKINPEIHKALGPLIAMSIRFALVKFGGGIVKMSGSLAGNTYARNRFGDYARSWKKPINPRSSRQESIRAIVSYLAEYWHGNLTAVQRGLWDTYAAAVAMKNKLGDTIYLTGFNHFIRSNAAVMAIGGGPDVTAPTILSLPEKDVNLVCSEENIAGQTFTFTCDVAGWGPNGDPKSVISLFQGQPQLASRNFFAGPWRLMGFISAVEGAAGTATEVAAFAFALGQKVWFQARLITESRRVTNVWTLDPRTVEADP